MPLLRATLRLITKAATAFLFLLALLIKSMRKLLQIPLWMIKGLLLLIALAALTLWPICTERWIGVMGEQFAVRGDVDEQHWFSAECQRGSIIILRNSIRHPEINDSTWFRDYIQVNGDGWRWKVWSVPPGPGDPVTWTNRLGPFCLRFESRPYGGGTRKDRMVGAPNWAVALLGIWPASSIVLAIRRRRQRRRAVLEGLCHQCGYDLRATPTAHSKGGALVPVCPECGAAYKAADPAGVSQAAES